MTTEKAQKSATLFVCEKCKYTTCKKSDYSRHILTPKHKNTTFIQHYTTKSANFFNNVSYFSCECGKTYPYRSSLHNHKKKCIFENEKSAKKRTDEITCQDSSKEVTLTNELIMKLLNDNKEMREIIVQIRLVQILLVPIY